MTGRATPDRAARCPHCYSTLPEDYRYCHMCGNWLRDAEYYLVYPGTGLPSVHLPARNREATRS